MSSDNKLIITLAGTAIAILLYVKHQLRNKMEKKRDRSSNSNDGGAVSETENQTLVPSPYLTLSSGKSYEVFLSFRGEDTRCGFTDYLYRRLVDVGISVFRDNEELRVGESIGHELYGAIQASKISVPIISLNYASSKWCLNELVHILECKKTLGQQVLPIFYKVVPSDVRHQTGSFGRAFEDYNKKHGFDGKLVQEWKNALADVSSLKGLESNKVANGHEGELVKIIVTRVLKELRKAILHIPGLLVGVENHVKKIFKVIGNKPLDNAIVIGIYGMGGIGKTTLAKVIYNKLLDSFEYRSFVSNVRETSSQHRGMEGLQKQVISDILMDKLLREISNVDEGISLLKQSYKGKKLLLLLDDVENRDQLNKLAGAHSWFGPQSIIIITTRNKEAIESFESSFCYELKELDFDQSFQLFCKHAFREDCFPSMELQTIAKDIVLTTGGLPLAIEVIGSSLSRKSRDIWKATLEKLKRIPNDEVMKKLRISYDALNHEQKQIFLDIACLPIKQRLDYAFYMWGGCGFYPEEGIDVLVSLSLIKIEDKNQLIIHDQLRDLGREIVRLDSHYELGKYSRLWIPEEAIEVMQQKRGTKKVQALDLCGHSKEFTKEHFENLTNLRFLKMENINLVGDFNNSLLELRWLEWHRNHGATYHLDEFLATAQLKKLVVLCLSFCILANWGQIELARGLKVLIVDGCENFTTTPNFSTMPELEVLSLSRCESLKRIHSSICNLNKTLKILNVCWCTELEELPIDVGKMEELREFVMDWTRVREIPISKGYMTKIEKLSADNCRSLTKIPKTIGNLKSLTELNLSSTGVTELPDSIGDLNNLKLLNLSYTRIRRLPTTIGMLSDLQVLNLRECQRLESLLNLPCSLTSLDFDGYSMETLPDISNLTCLKYLDYSDLFELRDRALNIGKLNQLDTLNIMPSVRLEYDFAPDNPSPFVVEGASLLLEISPSLVKLDICNCHTLRHLNTSNLRRLSEIDLTYCCGLMEINGLEEVETLRYLRTVRCYNLSKISGLGVLVEKFIIIDNHKLKATPHLTTAHNLKYLSISGCSNLVEIPGLDCIKGLQHLSIKNCPSYKRVSDVSNFDM